MNEEVGNGPWPQPWRGGRLAAAWRAVRAATRRAAWVPLRRAAVSVAIEAAIKAAIKAERNAPQKSMLDAVHAMAHTVAYTMAHTLVHTAAQSMAQKGAAVALHFAPGHEAYEVPA
ncbi:hypothetical protein HHL14_09860 [Paraburkholderia sp. G-4-1-8]|uniref:Uncharacterized protein n=1 Tax=Paraburkholderia antibiotica TaxID=2728839 RepID=A0A7X9X470_9BURK|nr:hypothetical protein [Paraburkholderia antibiotica]